MNNEQRTTPRGILMPRIILIIGGGIAAYKSLDLVRHLMRAGFAVDCVMTQGAEKFVTPLSFASLSGNRVRTRLFDDADESEMDHISLSRQADLVLVAPATAHLLARMAAGLADDLATTLLLATDTKIMAAPAMNWRMWTNAATKRNIAQLKKDGVHIIDPDIGEMACGEYGPGRLAEPEMIAQKAIALIDKGINEGNAKETPSQDTPLDMPLDMPLKGKTALITSGPTREAIDPVRYIANHSSGKQGHAIAAALRDLGARVILVSGKVDIPAPQGVILRQVESASDMMIACEEALRSEQKIDIAVCVAAVCDWRIKNNAQKIKKQDGQPPQFSWVQNPDILSSISHHERRPDLVIGFAAETENLLVHARQKMEAKKCDWIIANDVSKNVFDHETNKAFFVNGQIEEAWPLMDKKDLAQKLALRVAAHLRQTHKQSTK